MKRVFTSTCLAMLCAAGLAAQTQSADQNADQRRKTESARMDDKSVTIVGCLRAGDTPNSFVLANVKADEPAAKMPTAEPTPSNPPTPPTEPPSTPPTAPPSTPPATPPSTPPATPPTTPDPAASTVGTSGMMASGDVRLIGAPANLDLTKHVGHTVAITGSWAPASKSARPTGTSGTETAAAAEGKSFNVKSFAHRSDTCK